MTKFDWRNEIGRGGERRVEAFISEKLRFGYRKVGAPDIGIDGEIEIAKGSERTSTGGLLKVQVKATEESILKKRTFRFSIDEEHLDYFATLVVQPILMVVSITDDAIWWKPILYKSHYKGPRGGYGITFDTKADRLTAFSASFLRMLGNRSNAMIARYIVEEVEERLDDMDERREADNFDWVTTGIWGEYLVQAAASLRDAECLLRYERRYSEEITAIEERYHMAVERVEVWREFFKERGIEEQLNDD